MTITNIAGRRPFGRDCGICNAEPARVRCVIAEPLVDSVTTYVGANCYAVNAGATALLLAEDVRLVATEVGV